MKICIHEHYDPEEYIRNYDEFIREMSKERDDLLKFQKGR